MKHHILSIGITKYQIPEANNLRFAAKDAEEFFGLFTNNLDNLGYSKLLVDNEATLSQIRTSLGKELQDNLSPEDTLFVFFSGHGDIDKDQDGAYSHYLMPYDATHDVSTTGVSVNYLKSALDKIICKSKVIIVDSCFSGGLNTKHYPSPAHKSFKAVKTLQNTVTGQGEVVFTASKEDEESIEDVENKNGLFTYFFLKELQKDSYPEQIAVETLFTPISHAVTERAQAVFHHKQTPTMAGIIEGSLLLPKFKRKLTIQPEFIDFRTYNPQPVAVSVADLKVSEKDLQKQINVLLHFITNNQKLGSRVKAIELEKQIKQIFGLIKDEYEKILLEVGGDAAKIPESVSRLEAKSLQFVLIGNVIASYGDQSQMDIYAYYVGEILKLREGRAGLVALINISEVVVLLILVSVGMNCIARGDFEPFSILLNKVVMFNYEDAARLYIQKEIFYSDSLGGNSIKVHDHVREVMESYQWLSAFSPRLDKGTLLAYFCQFNLLMVLLLLKDNQTLWADFARHDANLVKGFFLMLRDDEQFRKKVSMFMGVNTPDLRKYIHEKYQLVKEQWRTHNGHWWRSVTEPEKLMYTPSELNQTTK